MASLIERFESQIAPEPISGCWLWSGAPKNSFGHGAFKLGPRKSPVLFAHRVSYQLYKGDPAGKVVRHTCDNPACVNPNHLEIGTHADNAADKVQRGRHPVGEAAYQAKATDALVLSMRALPRAEAISKGVAFGLSRQAANDIASRRTWRHLG